MRYGIIIDGVVTEPVCIPDTLPPWAADAAAFLAKMFPDKSGWVRVSDDAVPGTLYNGECFENPATPEGSAQPRSDMEIILERLDAIDARLGALEAP